MLLRRARLDDLSAISTLVERAYASYVERLRRKPAPMLDDYARKLRGAAELFVAHDGTVIAVIVLIPKEDHLLVENVAVEPSCQGRGVGRRLMALAEQRAVQLNLDEVRLYTNAAMSESALLPAARLCRSRSTS